MRLTGKHRAYLTGSATRTATLLFATEYWSEFANHKYPERLGTTCETVDLHHSSAARQTPQNWTGSGCVHGKLIVKPLREVDTALCSEYANGSYPTWLAIFQCMPKLRQAYYRRMRYGHGDSCKGLGNLQAFSPSQRYSRIMFGQGIHGEWFR